MDSGVAKPANNMEFWVKAIYWGVVGWLVLTQAPNMFQSFYRTAFQNQAVKAAYDSGLRRGWVLGNQYANVPMSQLNQSDLAEIDVLIHKDH